MTLITLPGIGGSGEDHWQTLWEHSDPSMRRFRPPDWDHPRLSSWCAALQTTVDEAQQPVVLVAHSLSCLLVAHWAAQSGSVVAGAFLVAVPDPESPVFPAEGDSFRAVPPGALPFPSLIVASANDPYGTAEYVQRRARQWQSEIFNVGAYGHINASSNLGAWPIGRALLEKFCEDIGADRAFRQ